MLLPKSSNPQRAPALRCCRRRRSLAFEDARNNDAACRLLYALYIVREFAACSSYHLGCSTSYAIIDKLHGHRGAAVYDVGMRVDRDGATLLRRGCVAIDYHNV